MGETGSCVTDVAALTVSLARPVVRGLLPLEHAEATIAAVCARTARAGTLAGNGDAADAFQFWTFMLSQHIDREDERRAMAADDIWRVALPMVRAGAGRQRVRAEAHDVNSRRGFCFSEAEVEQVLLDHLHDMKDHAEAKARATAPRRPMRRYHVG
jgi:hypothetical protein